jgi:hypothetical protein
VRSLFGLVLLVAFTALVGAACTVSSESGGAQEPIMDPVAATTDAGSKAGPAVEIDALTCAGVLEPATGDLSLETQSLTDGVRESQPQVVSMCSASYETGEVGGEFLTVALIQFDSDESSIAHYELIKSAFAASGVALSEINSADEGSIDQVSGLMDRDGVGRTNVLRQHEWLLSISVGPTMAESSWVVGDMEAIGRGVLGRVK